MDAAFGILGRTALRIDGRLDEGWGAPRERGVLATLLVHPGRPVPIDTLIEWVWPEDTSPPRNRATFHTYASRIRRSLERVRVRVALVAEDGSYRLEVDRAGIDYYLFANLMADARAALRQGQTAHAITLASQAIDLWRGPPLDDLSSEPARAWRTRVVEDEWIPANTLLLEALLGIDESSEVLTRLNDLQAGRAHDISLAKLRMSALHGLSRSEEATAYYFGVRRRLLEDGDEQAADHLRHHQEQLRVQATEPNGKQTVVPATRPRQLPHDIPDFVGRTDLLQALDTATTRPSREPGGGVVILDGMAGVGKTTLAKHWGHLARHRFPDGDLFVNLHGFSESAAVTQSRVVDDFLIALGHPPDKSLDQRSRELILSRLLANRRALVVLDNARDTPHVKDLIALLPTCWIIVTSRQRLTNLSATTGARRVRVEPMPTAEATELLSVRLGAHRQIDDDDRDRLVRLCGGLPLVITVLADHIATSGAAQLAAFAKQLDRRQLIVDIGEDGDGSAITHTLFSWSYQRLTPPEQRLFRLLGLHPGPDIGVDVACACDGRTPAQTKQSFGVLVGAHLLERPVAFDRYRFHDLLREFAIYCAERDETPQARDAADRRMLSFYLRSAIHANRALYPYRITLTELPAEENVEPVVFANTAEATFWFDQERSNLTAAVHFATVRGHHDHAWRLADAVATFFDRHGYYDDSRAVRERAVSSARAVGDREAETSSLEGLGMVQMILGDHASAQRCLDTALRYAIDDGNERAQATTLHLLGRLEMLRGDSAAAVELYRRCLDVAQRIDDQAGQCWTHCRIGEALRVLDQHDQALVHLHLALWYAQRIEDQSAYASSLATIGSVYRDRGDHLAAMAYAKQALGIAEAIPDLAISVQACTTLAETASERRDSGAATRYARHAVEVCERTHNMSAEARAREVLGDVYFVNGDAPDAVLAWQHAADLYDRTGNPRRSALVSAKIDKAPASGVDLPAARPDTSSPDVDSPDAVATHQDRPAST